MSQQPQKAAASEQQQQPVARHGTANTGNGRNSSQGNRPSATTSSKSSSQPQASQQKPTQTSNVINGAEGAAKSTGPLTWAARLASANGSSPAQEKPAASKPSQPSKPSAPGVKLPAGVNSGNSAQGSIKFGSIDPTDLQEEASAKQSGKVATAVPISVPAAGGSKPTSFAAAASGGGASGAGKQGPNAPQGQHRGAYPDGQGGRQGRGPQQQVPTVPTLQQQSGGFSSQQQIPYAVAPIYTGGQSYPMSFIQPAAPGYYGQNYAQAHPYPAAGFPYGSPVQTASGPHMPQLPLQTSQAAPSTTSYGSSAPTSPLPARPPAHPPAPRQKKILRIEDPDTHVSLNLDDIKKEVAKKAAEKAEEEGTKTEDTKGEGPWGGPKSFKDVMLTESEHEEAASGPVAKKPTEDAAPAKIKETELAMTDAHPPPPPPAASETGPSDVVMTVPFGSEEIQSEIASEATGFDDSSGRKRYTRDFLLSVGPSCTTLPPHIEAATLSALAIPPGGEKPRGPGGPPDRDWKSSGRAAPPAPTTGPPGMRVPRAGRVARQISGIDAETWERGKTLPPLPQQVGYGGRGPPPGMRMPTGPLPALHKSDSAYKMGKTVSENPEEEVAQKLLKSMLNKITPQNFEKITAQIIDKINERKKAVTLQGFIDQIFDKALTETNFAELYADLVHKLNPALPELEDEEGNPVQFRRTLLNKCQDEFEHGATAMKAVAEREKRKQIGDIKDEEQPIDTEVEEGELTDEQREQRDAAAEAKRRDKEAADAEVKARKRMLGNIIFVGQLYRFGVLTAKVMNSCIIQLLEETQNPRPEDVECLCKLLTTVGRPMDVLERVMKQADGSTVSTKDMMVVYFNRIQDLMKNEALDSRHRFMLNDLVDLRNNNWVERRKSEGPKKIEDIHRDAAMERNRSQMLDRQSSRSRDRDMRGPPRPPFENRVDSNNPIRPMKADNQESFGHGQSFRPLCRPPPPRPVAPPSGEPAPAVSEGAEVISVEDTKKKVKGLLAELYNSGDVGEAVLCLKELLDAGADMESVVDTSLTISLEGKGTSWQNLEELLKTASDEKIISGEQIQQGVRILLNKLDDMVVDVPKAPTQVGEVLASLIAAQAVDLKVIGQHILEADFEVPPEGEETMLISNGNAHKLLGVILRSLKDALSVEDVGSLWKATGLDHKDFMPSDSRTNDAEVDKFIEEFGLAEIV